MKRYIVKYGTDYCDDFADYEGYYKVEAESVEEAKEIFYKKHTTKVIIFDVEEIK